MSANDDVPMFGIGTVSRRTGLNAATIRSWETRYGIVLPHRSGSGQRLYSERQIRDLRWIAEQIRDGLQSGEAHRLLTDRVDDPPEAPVAARHAGGGEGFQEWSETSHAELVRMLRDVVGPTGVRAAMLGANLSHPVFGLSNSTVVSVASAIGGADGDLARFADLAWSLLPGPAGVLSAGRATLLEVEDLDEVGRALFGVPRFGALILVPVVVEGSWVGSVAGTVHPGVADPRFLRIVEAARDTIAGRYALARALRGTGVAAPPLAEPWSG
jgi:DNA-binding transcriptional MerR regulator